MMNRGFQSGDNELRVCTVMELLLLDIDVLWQQTESPAILMLIFNISALFTKIWVSHQFFSVETLSLGWSICAQGWRLSAEGWRQVCYQVKTGTVAVFSKKKKKVSLP
jgi:hypothetical protein